MVDAHVSVDALRRMSQRSMRRPLDGNVSASGTRPVRLPDERLVRPRNYLTHRGPTEGMSDVDDDIAELGRRALDVARVEPLRRRMRSFVAEHGRDVDLRALRRETGGGTPASELVDEGRAERL